MEKYISTEKMIFSCIVFQSGILVVYPVLDGTYPIWKFLVWGVFALASVIAVISSLFDRRKSQLDGTKFAISFAVINIVSFIWGQINGIPIVDYLSGLLPFLYLSYIYVVEKQKNVKAIKVYETVIGIVAIVQALKIIIAFIAFDCIHTHERVTRYVASSSQYTIILGIIFFYAGFVGSDVRKKRKVLQLLFFLLCWLAVLLTQTKSMLICATIGILLIALMCFTIKKNRRSYAIRNWIILICVVVLTFVVFASTTLGDRWLNSFVQSESNFLGEDNPYVQYRIDIASNDKEEEQQEYYAIQSADSEDAVVILDTNRIDEVYAAFHYWKESPILGKGCGYKWTSVKLKGYEPRIYMHNILAFFLMDYGLVGMIWLLIYAIFIIRKIVKILKLGTENIGSELYMQILMEFVVIVSAFVYANFMAVVRTIDFMFLFSIFTGFFCVNCHYVESINIKEEGA